MKRNLLETIMGGLVIIVAAFFVVTAYQSSGVKNEAGYEVTASFEQVAGVGIGSDVRIGGIKVGTIVEQQLDIETYRPTLTFSIKNDVKLPYDTSAEIVSESLLGGKYVSLVPGADEEMLSNGDEIEFTQSAINIEQLIGKFAFGGAEEESEE